MLRAAAERFQPHALVVCAGAGVLAGDRLGGLNLTLEGHSACLSAALELERPTLVLGAGGYTQLNAARAWCNATGTVCGVSLPERIPPHVYSDDYLPHHSLDVERTTMDNVNTAEGLGGMVKAAMATIEQMPARPASKPASRPVAAVDAATAPPAEPEPATGALDSAEHAAATAADAGGQEAGAGGDEAATVGTTDKGADAEPMDVDESSRQGDGRGAGEGEGAAAETAAAEAEAGGGE